MNPAHRPTQRLGRDRGSESSTAGVRPVDGALMLAVVGALVAALVVARPEPACAVPTEHEVKAALICNITRFVEWPVTAFRSPSAPLVVAIIGQDHVSDVLERILLRKRVNGHPLEVRRWRSMDDATQCHVLYVASSEKSKADVILRAVHGASTLTVADIEHFAEQGGHINLVLDDQRVHVFVNPASAAESHLTISARLLSLAQIVGTTR